MILTTHAITGAAIASIIPKHPILGFALGFMSHFILDSIPHWDYNLSSYTEDKINPLNNDIVISKKFIFDLFKIGLDLIIGFTFTFLFFGYSHPNYFIFALAAGAVGGILPDALQFLYFKWRKEPLVSLQKFHTWVHSKIRLNKRPFLGITTQIIIIFIIIFFQKILTS